MRTIDLTVAVVTTICVDDGVELREIFDDASRFVHPSQITSGAIYALEVIDAETGEEFLEDDYDEKPEPDYDYGC